MCLVLPSQLAGLVNTFTTETYKSSHKNGNISIQKTYFEKYLTESCQLYVFKQYLFKYFSNIAVFDELRLKLSDTMGALDLMCKVCQG